MQYIMTELQDIQEKYSKDTQMIHYKQEQTNDLYLANLFLFFIYYGLIIYFTSITYSSFRYSNMFYKKLFMIILLFLYPFIVYPVEHYIYNFITYIIGLLYSNIYYTENH